MARRLVEAGVEIVTTTFDGPLCGRVANWDDSRRQSSRLRRASLSRPVLRPGGHGPDRGHLRPRAWTGGCWWWSPASSAARRGSPTWPAAAAAWPAARPARSSRAATTGRGPTRCIWAGGGIATGQVIGATDRRGEDVVERRVGPHDFLATIYRHLGIDYEHVTIPDRSGRPTPIVTDGQAIPELAATCVKGRFSLD